MNAQYDTNNFMVRNNNNGGTIASETAYRLSFQL